MLITTLVFTKYWLICLLVLCCVYYYCSYLFFFSYLFSFCPSLLSKLLLILHRTANIINFHIINLVNAAAREANSFNIWGVWVPRDVTIKGHYLPFPFTKNFSSGLILYSLFFIILSVSLCFFVSFCFVSTLLFKTRFNILCFFSIIEKLDKENA